MPFRVKAWLLENATWYAALIVAMEVAMLEALHFYLIPHLWGSTSIMPFFEPNEASTRTAAIIASAAALLLSGVIIMAPLLSLSLHQSYDTLFELRKHLRAQVDLYKEVEDRFKARKHRLVRLDPDAARTRLIREVEERLRDQLRWYKGLNPPYLATWLTSVAVLTFVAIYSLFNGWRDSAMFFDALSFMVVSCILSVIFSFLAILFFAITRPGITKLDLFIKYFDVEK